MRVCRSMNTYWAEKQSSFTDAVKSGAALVCASGDKLLGGPQERASLMGGRVWC